MKLTGEIEDLFLDLDAIYEELFCDLVKPVF